MADNLAPDQIISDALRDDVVGIASIANRVEGNRAPVSMLVDVAGFHVFRKEFGRQPDFLARDAASITDALRAARDELHRRHVEYTAINTKCDRLQRRAAE